MLHKLILFERIRNVLVSKDDFFVLLIEFTSSYILHILLKKMINMII